MEARHRLDRRLMGNNALGRHYSLLQRKNPAPRGKFQDEHEKGGRCIQRSSRPQANLPATIKFHKYIISISLGLPSGGLTSMHIRRAVSPVLRPKIGVNSNCCSEDDEMLTTYARRFQSGKIIRAVCDYPLKSFVIKTAVLAGMAVLIAIVIHMFIGA
ncbi:hypothetical protein [Rhizobium leguminosarum]|uniref:hypothetical protein n=1 Tax=Rhizobium leguminosarum TaxID=384 RepID=UPI001440FF41|nr:hypothetical protein [Rhizobium leguminosarum]NKK80681.1 hypothetical protein [Rhizobium leguminosarum bv. viciae]